MGWLKNVLILLSFLVSTLSTSQTLITNDVLECVFKIKIDSFTGTGFLIGRPDSNLMVTARHILDSKYKNLDTVTYFVFGKDVWESYKGVLLLHQNPLVDIALIKPDSIGKWSPPFNSKIPSMFLGEDAIFLGYPYDIVPSRNLADYELHYPYPIFKKAMNCGSAESESIISYLFEGHNNYGFSGGPILLKSWKQQPLPTYNRLIAVVHGFYPGILKVEAKERTLLFPENSGIMIGVPAFYITEILEQNGYFNYW